MKYFTIILDKNELEKLHTVYQNHLEENNNPLIAFQARHNDCKITAYNSLKVVLQGEEIAHELILIKRILGRKDYAAIGADEVGTGDVFGPIVVCSAYVSIDDIPFLESLNVRDSKSMSDQQVVKIANQIAKKITHTLIILNPKKYNTLVKKGYNLNKIKALLHNQSILKTKSKVDGEIPVILDQFCSPQLYFSYLKGEMLIYRDIEFHVRAEQIHLSVACAAIIARYAFLVEMNRYGKKLGYKLVKGASKTADELIYRIYKEKGFETLELVAKTNYKNVTKQNLS